MIASTLLLSVFSIAVSDFDKPFQPLLDHLARQNGSWATNNARVAAAFYRSFDAIANDRERAVVDFVATDFDRAYWIGAYLTTPEYLCGHRSRPYLALAIWVNASDRLAAKNHPSGEDTENSRALNYVAAIEAERQGLHFLAVTFKKRAEAVGSNGVAVTGEEMDIYDSIKTGSSKATVDGRSRPSPGETPSPIVHKFNSGSATDYQRAWAKRLGEPVERTNSVGIKLQLIPPGEFQMGSNEAEDQKPIHRVRITKPFYLGTTNVTRGQFRKFIADDGYKTDAEKDQNAKRTAKPAYTWRSTDFVQGEEDPVVSVSWNDAAAFCKWLNKKEGITDGSGYWLPTEAQWEYACRAGTTKLYCFGDDGRQLSEYAWYDVNSGGRTHPVARKRPNAFGLFDMHGNATQWCADWFAFEYYEKSPIENPIGPSSGTIRSIRGGAWSYESYICTAGFRGNAAPGNCSEGWGFRVCLLR